MSDNQSSEDCYDEHFDHVIEEVPGEKILPVSPADPHTLVGSNLEWVVDARPRRMR